MMFRPRLLTPGPVELHPKALEALSKPQMHHRNDDAIEVFSKARDGLKKAFKTEGEVIILTGSGTSAMDALVLNLFTPGQRVFVPVHGNFSERWVKIAREAGLEVVSKEIEWGKSVELADLDGLEGSFDGVLLTHSESSTGALNDVKALAEKFKAQFPDSLVVVDAITSLFVTEFALESWGIDGAACGSQKGVMCPPGLGYAALSPRAIQNLKPRSFYLNLGAELKVQPGGQSAWTPAINLIAATAAVLDEIVPNLDSHLALKKAQNDHLYAAGEALGLKVVPAVRSASTTCFYLPEGVTYAMIKKEFGIRGATIIGGQGILKGKIFRISLLGYSDMYDAYAVAAMLKDVSEALK